MFKIKEEKFHKENEDEIFFEITKNSGKMSKPKINKKTNNSEKNE